MVSEKIMSTSFTNDYTEAADALRDFYLRSHRALDKLMGTQGTTLARAKMLVHIGRNGPLRSTDLAEAFGFAPRTITEAVDGMERDGLVERIADTGDRRVKQISLTELGREVLCTSEPLKQRFGQRLFEALDQKETRQLALLLNKLNSRLAELEGEMSEAAEQTHGKRGRK
jgi:DNA-binding MarR family transcriptional regulator